MTAPLIKVEWTATMIKDDTGLAAEGAWTGGDKMRAWGSPGQKPRMQTIGGQEKATLTQFQGVCRGIITYSDLVGASEVVFCTHTYVYAYTYSVLADITPNRVTGTLMDPFSTLIGDATVTVDDVGHGLIDGARVAYPGGPVVGGIATGTSEHIVTVIDPDTYSWVGANVATSTETGVGGSVDYEYRINPGLVDTTGPGGWGTGAWGIGPWGASTPSDNYARTGSMDTWGQDAVFCLRGGPLFEWAPPLPPNPTLTVARAYQIPNAPIQNNSMFVTAERIMVALGTIDIASGDFDPLLERWSDQENNQQWTPSATNLSGDFRFSKGTRLMRGIPTTGRNLIFTDSAYYRMRFLGDPILVYGFDLMGTDCGLIGQNAVAEASGKVYWMSRAGKFMVDAGGGPQELECTGRQYVFENLSFVQADKIYCGINAAWNEVWWFYPDRRDGNEVSRAVTYNWTNGAWCFHTFTRTAWADAGVLPSPLAADITGYLLFHERGHQTDGGAPIQWRLESAWFDIQDGDKFAYLDGFIPDFGGPAGSAQMLGGCTITIETRRFPNDTSVVYGPYGITSATQAIDFRATGRQARVIFQSNSAPAFARFGANRLRLMQTGSRR